MFDTHCHLNDPVFENNLLKVINNARDEGVKKFLIPGMNMGDIKKSLKISTDFENVYTACAIHPTEKLDEIETDKLFYDLQKLIDDNEIIIAIGETGLDYYKYKSPVSLQKQFLEEHIKLAIKNDLPLIIHNRHATTDLIPLLIHRCISSNFNRIVLHCCPPEKELLNFVSTTGPKSVIITDGANGAYAKENTNYYHIGILPVDAISRTGAGDAFSAGCLSALIKGKTLPEALIWGTVNSTSVIGYVGPQTGLLKESGMATWMDRARSSGVRVEKF